MAKKSTGLTVILVIMALLLFLVGLSGNSMKWLSSLLKWLTGGQITLAALASKKKKNKGNGGTGGTPAPATKTAPAPAPSPVHVTAPTPAPNKINPAKQWAKNHPNAVLWGAGVTGAGATAGIVSNVLKAIQSGAVTAVESGAIA